MFIQHMYKSDEPRNEHSEPNYYKRTQGTIITPGYFLKTHPVGCSINL